MNEATLSSLVKVMKFSNMEGIGKTNNIIESCQLYCFITHFTTVSNRYVVIWKRINGSMQVSLGVVQPSD